ncbi:NAD(P)(+) transhydrogenase (Re/Si-specific) subunit beta [Parasphaerochaeta coccoides]|uniref:NAD(P) transhydrogenase subunit beta n=1 Tax=Parasphaerochaeta coccoides (strain ATCC BAA-1237 / DSM 17374 / SPN1) TaxID=760011 RepID=F4GIT7_PARC1|nr:NAD(P)(+) transhydrogenase (Re/Si-specific) subunit beta [Parasphaerochaeta coccoides]AEC02705.1 NAD(P)(+) transhydrogenase (AB-specific) [Parasphaerochaeta coccoides DSM 17374]
MNILVNSVYLVAAAFFIIGLKGLSRPDTAVRGNLLGAVGMFLAVLVTVIAYDMLNPLWILGGILLGSIVGTWMALKVKMTAMPQMVGLLSGFGGIASLLVAVVSFLDVIIMKALELNAGVFVFDTQFIVSIVISVFIGALTFWGSMVASGKLQGVITTHAVKFRGDQVVKVLVMLAAVASMVGMVMYPGKLIYLWLLIFFSSFLGILLTISIGGADMPIVISLLNSYSGLAVAATGFVLDNTILIISGAIVGASGIILTQIMCKAMNRSLANVIFGGVGGKDAEKGQAVDIYAGKVKTTDAEEIAMILKSANRVVFIPGYGMAVSRAQNPVRMLSEALEKDDIEVEFGIHPVAGRMPGHMNVLLAEENIPYDKLKELEQINPTFPVTDVAVVIGANDVVNPLAHEEGNPISGMPVLDVGKARTVIVVKRSLSPGFAEIANPLFIKENTLLFYADGKKAAEEILAEYKKM